MILVKNAVHLFSYKCSDMEVHSLFEKVQVSDICLIVFYKNSNFISHSPKNHNYGEMFTDLINNPFALHISYLDIYSRLCFNLLKDVTEFVSFNYFSRERLEDKLKSQKCRDIFRALVNCYCMLLKKLLLHLSANIDPIFIERIYHEYLPKRDFNLRQIEIIRKKMNNRLVDIISICLYFELYSTIYNFQKDHRLFCVCDNVPDCPDKYGRRYYYLICQFYWKYDLEQLADVKHFPLKLIAFYEEIKTDLFEIVKYSSDEFV